MTNNLIIGSSLEEVQDHLTKIYQDHIKENHRHLFGIKPQMTTNSLGWKIIIHGGIFVFKFREPKLLEDKAMYVTEYRRLF